MPWCREKAPVLGAATVTGYRLSAHITNAPMKVPKELVVVAQQRDEPAGTARKCTAKSKMHRTSYEPHWSCPQYQSVAEQHSRGLLNRIAHPNAKSRTPIIFGWIQLKPVGSPRPRARAPYRSSSSPSREIRYPPPSRPARGRPAAACRACPGASWAAGPRDPCTRTTTTPGRHSIGR